MSLIEIGSIAPEFELPRDGGNVFSSTELNGRAFVLFFYPKDNTSGCTREATEFSAAQDAFDALGVTVLGVSKDSVKKHDNFRDKFSLTVPLLSDEQSDMCERYGVWTEKTMYGRKFMGIQRSTFLVGADGIVKAVWPKVKVPGHVDAVLEAAKDL